MAQSVNYYDFTPISESNLGSGTYTHTFSMDGFNKSEFDISVTAGSNTLTYAFSGGLDSDSLAPLSNDLFGSSSFSSSEVFLFKDFCPKYIKLTITITGSATDSSYSIKARKFNWKW